MAARELISAMSFLKNSKSSEPFSREILNLEQACARKFERVWGARFDRRASRSVLCSSRTFKFISYNLILKLKRIL